MKIISIKKVFLIALTLAFSACQEDRLSFYEKKVLGNLPVEDSEDALEDEKKSTDKEQEKISREKGGRKDEGIILTIPNKEIIPGSSSEKEIADNKSNSENPESPHLTDSSSEKDVSDSKSNSIDSKLSSNSQDSDSQILAENTNLDSSENENISSNDEKESIPPTEIKDQSQVNKTLDASKENDLNDENIALEEEPETENDVSDENLNKDTDIETKLVTTSPENLEPCSNILTEQGKGSGNQGNGVGNTGPGNQGNEKLVGNAGGNPCLTLREQKDSFFQKSKREADVDILWIIDNSGSMKNEQEDLARNFDAFIQDFIQKDIDFRMGITTTDSKGKMQGSFSELTTLAYKENPDNFFKNFSKNIKVGTNGPGTEKGLESSVNFLKKYNTEFLRENAYLIVIFVSDEEDQSNKTSKALLEQLQSFKSHAGFLKIYSIVNTQSSLPFGESKGSKYINLAEETHGSVANIKEDFYPILSDFGTTIVELLEKFSLSSSPFQNEIKGILVDGEEVDSSDWSFNSEDKTIEFISTALPDAGSLIEISYFVSE